MLSTAEAILKESILVNRNFLRGVFLVPYESQIKREKVGGEFFNC